MFYAAGPPEAQLCGASRVAVVGGGNSAGQAAIWLARGGALVTLLHRRADLRETMSDYLIRRPRALRRRRSRPQRDRRPAWQGRQLEAVTLKDGERLPFSFLFLFLGAQPCTEWLDDAVARDDDGFILTGAAAGADDLLETSVPGVVRRRRRPLRLDQALRHRGRRRRDGRTGRPHVPRSSRKPSRMSEVCTHPERGSSSIQARGRESLGVPEQPRAVSRIDVFMNS